MNKKIINIQPLSAWQETKIFIYEPVTNGDDAVNYGIVEVIIELEMTHGFDDQKSQYDHKNN